MLQPNTRSNAAPGGGSEQSVDLLNDRWIVYLSLPVRRHADAHALRAYLHRFRGMVNTVNVHPFMLRENRGTFTGTITTSGSTAQGASSVVLTGGSASQTLKAGDFFGVSSQLFEVAEDATANGSGVITVNITGRVRATISTGTSVTLTQPTIACRKLSDSGVNYSPGQADEVQITLGEVIA